MNYTPTGFSGQSNPQPTLKPCPFCNGKVKLELEYDLQGDVRNFIWCPECHMECTKVQWWDGYEESKIIEEWNGRVN